MPAVRDGGARFIAPACRHSVRWAMYTTVLQLARFSCSAHKHKEHSLKDHHASLARDRNRTCAQLRPGAISSTSPRRGSALQ